MTDLTPLFSQLLSTHNARPLADTRLVLTHMDEFLKEAYRLNAHINSLHTYLVGVRPAYLSTAPAPFRTRPNSSRGARHLDTPQKEAVDAETKRLLRSLNARIRSLAEAEQLRQNTATTLLQKKYARIGLGALGSWAAGGLIDGTGRQGKGKGKGKDQLLEEDKVGVLGKFRDGVLWYLREKLREAGEVQAGMMEKRIGREMERSRSLLAGAKSTADLAWADSGPVVVGKARRSDATDLEKSVHAQSLEGLSEEQIQMFEQENHGMLEHYESKLDQVKTAEKSLIEISELQTQLVNNLAIQSAHIEQLETDSFLTTDNVGSGNKELKKASERTSTARYVFWASCSLSAFLIAWDLLI